MGFESYQFTKTITQGLLSDPKNILESSFWQVLALDFGQDGRFGNFDLWRLPVFAELGANQFPEFTEKEIQETIFLGFD